MDQFRHLQPGDQLDGLPSPPWNHFLEATKARLGAKRSPLLETSVEFDVVNGTGSPISRFGILGANAPLYTFAANPDNFFDSDTLQGIAPAANQPFVVMQEPVSAGGVGRGRILGITRVRVNITDTSHQFCGPTASTEYLTSAASGLAEIIWTDAAGASGSGSGGTGLHWAVVLLGGGDNGGGRVEPGQPRNDGVVPPRPEFASWDRLNPNLDTMTLEIVEPIWFWDLNASP